MIVEFDDKKVQRLFEDLVDVRNSRNLMTKEVGVELTRAVKKRLDQIVAFEYFSELQNSGLGRMESLLGDMHGDYSLRTTANYRIIVTPKSIERSAEALKKCDTLIIKGVIDYMEKQAKSIGLSRDLIIHPGESLEEALIDRNMSQKELAVRTGFSEKHVSTVVCKTKPISVAFAMKLEIALGIEASFWVRLQAGYDRELIEHEEVNNICNDEIAIIERLKDVIENGYSTGWLTGTDDPISRVLELRRKLAVSNLLSIPNIPRGAASRAQVKNDGADLYVLYARNVLSEWLRSNIQTGQEADLEKIKGQQPATRELRFADADRT